MFVYLARPNNIRLNVMYSNPNMCDLRIVSNFCLTSSYKHVPDF